MKCYHNEYCEEVLEIGADYDVRGYKKEYGLVQIMCQDGKTRWFNEKRFEGGIENDTYWNCLRLGHNGRGLSKLDSYPSGNYSKWYNNQNGTKC